jgi:hypothetical protein
VAALRRPQLAREGVLVVGPNRVFIAYISQVLPSLGEQSVDQRPIDGLVSRRRWDGEDSDERATLLGSGRMAAALSGCCGTRSGRPPRRRASRSRASPSRSAPDDVAEVIAEARTRQTFDAGRARFRDRLADRIATEVMRRSASAGQADPETVLSAVRQTREYQKLASSSWPRTTPEALVAQLFKNRRRLTAVTGDLLSRGGHRPVARHAAGQGPRRPTASLRCSTRRGR